MSPIYAFSGALLVVCVVLTIWRGGGPERLTAVALVLSWIGATLFPFNFLDPPWASIIGDAIVTLMLIYFALFSNRRWAIWASAFHILVMATHLAFARLQGLEQWAYVTSLYVWADLGMLALALGTLTRKHRVNTPASPRDDENGRR
jgi:hypothetical protein